MFKFEEVLVENYSTEETKSTLTVYENSFYKLDKVETLFVETGYKHLSYTVGSKENLEMPKIYVREKITTGEFIVDVSTTSFSNTDLEFVEEYANKLLLAAKTAREIRDNLL